MSNKGDEIVTVTRTLTYVGKRRWVERTLDDSIKDVLDFKETGKITETRTPITVVETTK